MEQIILEAITKHMKEKKVTESSQHGYMKGKPCLMNLIAFRDEITGWQVVYFDFSKIFDTVSHNILVDKMMKYGLDKQWVGLKTELRGSKHCASENKVQPEASH